MTTQSESAQSAHHRAVRFFWSLLIGATTVSLIGNVVHAVLPYMPPVAVQIGAAAVPPVVLLAALHGIALAVRAGASGRIYCLAVGAVAVIGLGAFAMSFLALTNLAQAIGYSSTTAWIFPAIIDTAVAVSTLMLVALGDKPPRRTRTAIAPASAQAKVSAPPTPAPFSVPARSHSVRGAQVASSAESAPDSADAGNDHGALAQALVDAGATTKPAAVVVSILAAHAEGRALNRIASDTGVHHKTVSKIIDAAATRRHLVMVS